MKSNNFDFNKSFLHGISSLRRDDEKRLLDEIANTKAHTDPGDKIEVNHANIKTLKVAFDRVWDTDSCLIFRSRIGWT